MRRFGFNISHRVPIETPVPAPRQFGTITAEIRVFWPAEASDHELLGALEAAVDEARARVLTREDESRS